MTRPANASFWEWPWRRHGRVSSSESCVGSGAERVNRRCLRSFCWVLSRFFAIGAWGPAEALQGSCSCSWSRSVCPDSITSTMTREWVPGGGMTGYRPGDVSPLQAFLGSGEQTTCPGPLTSLRGKPLAATIERVFCFVKTWVGLVLVLGGRKGKRRGGAAGEGTYGRGVTAGAVFSLDLDAQGGPRAYGRWPISR